MYYKELCKDVLCKMESCSRLVTVHDFFFPTIVVRSTYLNIRKNASPKTVKIER